MADLVNLEHRAHQFIAQIFQELRGPRPTRQHSSIPAARICIDPGHGGRDPGASAEGTDEKVLALGYSLLIGDALRTRGHTVLLTRDHDTDLAPGEPNWRGVGKQQDLLRRSTLANEFGADCFVSIHLNANESTSVRGAWVLYAKTSSRGEQLAEIIFRELLQVPHMTDADQTEEVFSDDSGWTGNRRISVLRRTEMPAVLVELGFITNPDDKERLQEPETKVSVANAIADGVEAWLLREKKSAAA